jgi:hypothetical protein
MGTDCKCTILHWPVRKQILVFFIITTVLIEAALYLIIKLVSHHFFVSHLNVPFNKFKLVLQFINAESSDAIIQTVFNRTQTNMNNIAQ